MLVAAQTWFNHNKGNKCRALTCQDVFNQWASQTSMNSDNLTTKINECNVGSPTSGERRKTCCRNSENWPINSASAFSRNLASHIRWTNKYPSIFLPWPWKTKGNISMTSKPMNSKLVLPSITCEFFAGKQSPPATWICQIVLLILNWKVYTIAGKKPLPPNKDVNGVKFPLALIHLHSLHLGNTVSARKRRDSQCKCHCRGPERKGAVTSTRASEFPNDILRGQWESQSPNGSKKHWDNQKQVLLLQALAHVQGSRVIYLVLAFQLVIRSLSYTLSMKLHVLPSHL